MTSRFLLSLVLGSLVASTACAAPGPSAGTTADAELRPLTSDEVLTDLDAMAALIRGNYGPLAYKKERFGFDLDAEVAAAKTKITAATTEADRIRPLYELLAKLRDGHVGLRLPIRATETSTHSLPFFVTWLASGYVIGADHSSGPKLGDELVSIDGIGVDRLEELLRPITEIGTPESTRHKVAAAMTARPFYAPAELAPKGTMAEVVVRRGGTTLTFKVDWLATLGGVTGLVGPSLPPPVTPLPPSASAEDAGLSPHLAYLLSSEALALHPELAGTPMATRLGQGRLTPFYMTPQTTEHLGAVRVEPKPETLAAAGVTIPESEATNTSDFGRFINLRAYKYRFAGKTVLLVRIPGFTVPQNNYEENVGWMTALLQDNVTAEGAAPDGPEVPLADAKPDVLVVDVAHNPGGAVSYTQGLASLFTSKPIGNTVQASRANRRLVANAAGQANMANSLRDEVAKQLWTDRMLAAEAAIDRGDLLAPFAALTGNWLGPNVVATGGASAGDNLLAPHPTVHWNKPMLVLQDELSGSGGDAFPMMMQGAGVKTFGARTAGMGGNRLDFPLPISGATLSLTGGLFGAFREDGQPIALIENNGVTPDLPYDVTPADFKSGYIGYVTAFSQAAVGLLR